MGFGTFRKYDSETFSRWQQRENVNPAGENQIRSVDSDSMDVPDWQTWGYTGHRNAPIIWISGSQGTGDKTLPPKLINRCDISKPIYECTIEEACDGSTDQRRSYSAYWSMSPIHERILAASKAYSGRECAMLVNLCPHHHKTPDGPRLSCIRAGKRALSDWLSTNARPDVILVQAEMNSRYVLPFDGPSQILSGWESATYGNARYGRWEGFRIVRPAYTPNARDSAAFGRPAEDKAPHYPRDCQSASARYWHDFGRKLRTIEWSD